MPRENGRAVRLDVLGLSLAGLINTFLAPFFAVVVFGPGTPAGQESILLRLAWIADHPDRWQGGWLFWFAVTLSFAWSYYALGRHLGSLRPWRDLAVGVALIAAAVDLVGVLVNITVMPEIAAALIASPAASDPALLVLFQALEQLTNALTNVAAFGLYSLAGLLLLPALFATSDYPRWLAKLGAAEWIISAIASLLLAFAPQVATAPMLIGFVLYAPWVWASGLWLLRREAAA